MTIKSDFAKHRNMTLDEVYPNRISMKLGTPSFIVKIFYFFLYNGFNIAVTQRFFLRVDNSLTKFIKQELHYWTGHASF